MFSKGEFLAEKECQPANRTLFRVVARLPIYAKTVDGFVFDNLIKRRVVENEGNAFFKKRTIRLYFRAATEIKYITHEYCGSANKNGANCKS